MLRFAHCIMKSYAFNFSGITMLKISTDSPTSMMICS
jgi:hypothetical protein